jgi:hypothetical protein
MIPMTDIISLFALTSEISTNKKRYEKSSNSLVVGFKTVKELTLPSNFLHFVFASAIDIANLIAELSFSLADHS